MRLEVDWTSGREITSGLEVGLKVDLRCPEGGMGGGLEDCRRDGRWNGGGIVGLGSAPRLDHPDTCTNPLPRNVLSFRRKPAIRSSVTEHQIVCFDILFQRGIC